MVNVKEKLEQTHGVVTGIQLNTIDLDPQSIKAIMINEVVPHDPADDFYGQPDADYMKTTIPLFQQAGIAVNSIVDILAMGIYITNAVKTPKSDYTVEKEALLESLPYLKTELSLFPNLKVVMLMGDVAKRAFNMIHKKQNRKNIVPSTATYKIRHNEIHFQDKRIMPSYIMTGKNILIEKSKFQMVVEDIENMVKLI
ncbi:uracil-DNA glycosylase family protein [Amphibacillus cookii]|uniref:uracil-DNA glycosylase family protein n=1 Tax=Amphibacillus cookii TaxID=767787 RepID=UPI001EF806B4|nr:uracil-DNA glycosylase family protein [Amphibacillus cookii]MBM7542277.1 uracil-DNA glycosylase [Amphibacillus cookii]